MKTKGFVPPQDVIGAPAAPVAIMAADSDQLIDFLVAHSLAGRVDATSTHTALQLCDSDMNPTFITIEMGRHLSRELDVELTLLRELDPSDPEETANFVVHPDGSFWPVSASRLPALVNRVPALIGADDMWFVAHRPTGKGANAPAAPPMPNGLLARDLIPGTEWVGAGIQAAEHTTPCDVLTAPDWSDLTALIRVTSREVTIWRAGKGGKALQPLSWGYQRTWVHPSHGVIARDSAATATAFAASWRRAGGSAAEAPLVELHRRSRLDNLVLRPALTALGLPAAMVSHLCAQIPAEEQSPDRPLPQNLLQAVKAG